MEAKFRFNIVKLEGESETKLWSGRCTADEMYRRFDAAIKAQIIKYNTDGQACQLRAYNEHGMIVAQETFHER